MCRNCLCRNCRGQMPTLARSGVFFVEASLDGVVLVRRKLVVLR